jgi:tetratricopeptide (TPR) repeat protein
LADWRDQAPLSGKATLSDERAPDESIVIEFVCRGTVRTSVSADPKGRFILKLPAPTAKDLAAYKYLEGCQLRAVLAGYRSDVVDLSKRKPDDSPEVGTIVLRRAANVEGTTISSTTADAPKDARKAFAKARTALGTNKNAIAQAELEEAVRIYPKYAAAWLELGRLFESHGSKAKARHAYQEAIDADPKFVPPYERLMMMAGMEGKSEEVVRLSIRLIELDPQGFLIAYLSKAVANYNLGDLDASQKSATKLLELDTEHRFPKAERVLGMVLAEKHEWQEAAAHLCRYLEMEPTGSEAEAAKRLLAEVEQAARTRK